jgi:hypothetical protein
MTKTYFSLNVSKISTNILVPNHALPKTNFFSATNNFNDHLILKHKNMEDLYQNGFVYNNWPTKTARLQSIYIATLHISFMKETPVKCWPFVRQKRITLSEQQTQSPQLCYDTPYI